MYRVLLSLSHPLMICAVLNTERPVKSIPLSISEVHTPQPSPFHKRPSADNDDIIPISTSVPIEIRTPDQSSDKHKPIALTPSNGSVKSLDKPVPPPKPSTLRRTKTPEGSPAKTPRRTPDLERSVEPNKPPFKVVRVVSDGKVRGGSGSSYTLPLKPVRRRSNEQPKTSDGAEKSVSTENVSTPKESSTAPPKPARRSIKHSGVTTELRKQSQESKNDNDNEVGIKPAKPKEVTAKPKEVSAKPHESSAKTQEASSKPLDGTAAPKPKQGSPAEQRPPPKPSRNYKSVRILPQPPASTKPAKPVKPVSAETTNGNVKPSEVLKRNRSPVSVSNDQSKSADKGPIARERQLPKPRDKVDTPKKPSPPKPARKSIKLKTVE